MSHLVYLLLQALAFQSRPLCAPAPEIVWTAPPDVKNERECQLYAWPEYRCKAVEGTAATPSYVVLHRWYADVDGVPYKVEVRERVFGKTTQFAAQRVYRNGERVTSAPLLSLFEGAKMRRVRPDACDLPTVTLEDA